MKRSLLIAFLLVSTSAFADNITINEIANKGQLENVGKEFAANFAHSVVAAPETDGLWGIEIGIMGGSTKSSELAKLVEKAGEDGSEFERTHHGGLLLRAHVPLEIFAEALILPEIDIAGVKVKNRTFGAGWNAGAFFNWPLDLAIGATMSNADVSFEQRINNTSGNGDADIAINARSTSLWLGASKTFAFFTPYVKAGLANTKSSVDVDAAGTITIFTFSGKQKEEVSSSGMYLAAGANAQLSIIKLGVEVVSIVGVNSISGKLSLDF